MTTLCEKQDIYLLRAHGKIIVPSEIVKLPKNLHLITLTKCGGTVGDEFSKKISKLPKNEIYSLLCDPIVRAEKQEKHNITIHKNTMKEDMLLNFFVDIPDAPGKPYSQGFFHIWSL